MTAAPWPTGPVPAAAKPLVRRSTLVRKRDELEGTASLASSKRTKVTFSDNVDVQDLHELGKAPEVILEEVRRAFQRHAQGEDSGYEDLKSVYTTNSDSEKAVSSATLKSYTMALLSNVSSLGKSCSDLVLAVLRSEWLGREEEYIRVYVRLIANIVSSQGMFVAEALRILVENLTCGENYGLHRRFWHRADNLYRASFQWRDTRPTSYQSFTYPLEGPSGSPIPTQPSAISKLHTSCDSRRAISSRIRHAHVACDIRPKLT